MSVDAQTGTWLGRTIELEVGAVAHGGHCVARAEGRVRFRAVLPPDSRGGRHMMGLAITADGRSFGELAEAMVDLPE